MEEFMDLLVITVALLIIILRVSAIINRWWLNKDPVINHLPSTKKNVFLRCGNPQRNRSIKHILKQLEEIIQD